MDACSGRASCPKTALVANMRHHLVRAFHSTLVSEFGVLLALSALQSHTAHNFCRCGSHHASGCIRRLFTSKSQIYDHMLYLLRALLPRKCLKRRQHCPETPHLYLSIYVSNYLLIYGYFMIFLSLSVDLSIWLSIWLSVYRSIYKGMCCKTCYYGSFNN